MWILLFVVTILTFAPHVSAAVVINEMLPKSSDVKYSWIELYNTGPGEVALDQWRLENASGGGASSFLNASAHIAPNGFLTFYQPQTGITFNIEGDMVRLFDDKNNLADSQSYPGVLGYNTSMGRSTDGGAGWVICAPDPYVYTPNKPNKCPVPPTNTPTPIPTVPSANSPTQIITKTSFIPTTPTTQAQIPTPPIDSSSKFAFPNVLGDADAHTPTPTPTPENYWESDTYKKIWVIALLVGVGSAICIMIIGLLKSFRH